MLKLNKGPPDVSKLTRTRVLCVLPVRLVRSAFRWALGCADVCLQVDSYKEAQVL